MNESSNAKEGGLWCPSCRRACMHLESESVLRCWNCGYHIKGELLADMWTKYGAIDLRVREGMKQEIVQPCPVCGTAWRVLCVPVLDTGNIAYSWGECCEHKFVLPTVEDVCQALKYWKDHRPTLYEKAKPKRTEPCWDHQQVFRMLNKAKKLIRAKAHDYARTDNVFSNFEFSGEMLDRAVAQGVSGADLGFLALIATKIARMITLRGKGAEPANEPIEDTVIDLANYAALWGAYATKSSKPV